MKKIHFSEHSETRPWHEVICYLPNLEVMHHCDDCVDEYFSGIAEYCPNIQEIELLGFSHKITNAGLKSLCKIENGNISCSKLKSIRIYFCDVPKDAATYLIKNLPSLEHFNSELLPQLLYALHHKDLPTIDKVVPYKFTELELFAASKLPHYGDLLKVCFSLCPNLKSLEIPVWKPEQLNLLYELSNLETLLIDNFYEEEYLDINDFLKLKGSKLTSLKLRKCLVSLTTLARHCQSLNALYLVYSIVECEETSIPPFKNLEPISIGISELCVSDKNFESACLVLSSSPKLESMALRKVFGGFGVELKTAVLKCCEKSLVKEIDLCGCMVEKQFILDILSTCHSLSILKLDKGNYDDEIYKCAKLLPNNPEIYFIDGDYEAIFDFYFDYEYDAIRDPYDS